MLPLSLFLSLALFLASCPSLAQTPRQPSLPSVRYAAPGQTVTGEVVKEDDDELQLNARPCGSEGAVVIFRKPYTREAAGNVRCGGDVKSLIQAVKK